MRALLIIVLAVAIMAYYFDHVGHTTGKNELARDQYPTFNGPYWLLSPVLYLTGGISALSTALTNNFDPFDHPGSTYLFSKVGNLYDHNVHAPNTIAKSINIPAPFNVYNGFGRLYFDRG